MKLHIHGNSLRLSVSESDLARLRWENCLESWMGLGPGRRFTYRLEYGPDDRAMAAELQDDALTIVLPRDTSTEWMTSGESRFEAMQMIDGEQQLHIIVERELDATNGLAPQDAAREAAS